MDYVCTGVILHSILWNPLKHQTTPLIIEVHFDPQKYEFADCTILADFAYISYLCLFIYLWCVLRMRLRPQTRMYGIYSPPYIHDGIYIFKNYPPHSPLGNKKLWDCWTILHLTSLEIFDLVVSNSTTCQFKNVRHYYLIWNKAEEFVICRIW